ncbi:prepilin-type N-terminal cleavage/methylation domain-containing protein [Patescibacteria group bacterium]|nr:prepilin-type N-terminal cleavage/methylation domain-containing protein [Patescibacteria group bacterium]MBP9710405.1 prepilin-type N-terminal cleavage/methylation domain-containing protein [Patescibacteria group bacterium]
MLMRRLKPGFTILEILIVLAVFGLLATLAVLSLNSARARVRDAQRLSDVSTISAGLSRYWLEKATYPSSAGIELGKPGSNAEVLSAGGFEARQSAQQPIYLDRLSTGPKVNEFYYYKGGANGYSIRFVTESDTDLGKANVFYAHANGVIDGKDEEK